MSLSFANAAADALLEHGPLGLPQLHAAAVESGATKARTASSLRHSLDADERFVLRPDGTYDTAARLLRGAVLTTRRHRGSDGDVLWTTRDIEPFAVLTRTGVFPLQTGGELRRGQGSALSWIGPPGWLAGASDALVGLRWDGRALAVERAVEGAVEGAADRATEAVAADSGSAQDLRVLLSRHARGLQASSWTPTPSLAAVVLSALIEVPDALRHPLPPLSELLPLPEELRPQDSWGGVARDPASCSLTVPLPARVHAELARRADLLGDQLPGYAAMLLGAAADRLGPAATPVRCCCSQASYDADGPAYGDRWSR